MVIVKPLQKLLIRDIVVFVGLHGLKNKDKKCENVGICKCENVKMWEYENVRM